MHSDQNAKYDNRAGLVGRLDDRQYGNQLLTSTQTEAACQSSQAGGVLGGGYKPQHQAASDGRVGAMATGLAAQAFQSVGRNVDSELLFAFAQILQRELTRPWLGNATTGELIDELRARSDLGYRTVGG